ncbi:iron dependent repressor, metal binding and dimerization domain protein, partial [Arthrospira platensis SPKY1]|nr:iron dependent repressor, metal binding and dimerization domain protein [Arthrospira platensis SPKY1]
QGLVLYSKSKSIQLTPEGETIAKRSAERHALVVQLLCGLGVSPETAEADAEGAEHHFSEETLAAIRRFLAERN